MAVLIGLFVVVHAIRPLAGEASSDVRQYVALGANLARHGVFAEGTEPGRPLIPTAYREPGWPLLLAAPIALDPALRGLSNQQIVDLFDPASNPSHARPWSLRLPGLVMLLACALLTGLLAAKATGHGMAFAAAFLLTGFNPWLAHYADGCFQEALTTPLLLAASAAMLWAAIVPRWWSASLAGLLWAGLVLTSARFLYLTPVPVLVLVWAAAWPADGRSPRRWLMVGCFIVACALPVGAWMMRNLHQIGQPVVALRGGRLLALRASYNEMTGREYVAAMMFRDASQSRLVERLGRGWLGDAPFEKLDRKNPDGFYQIGKTRRPATGTRGAEPGATQASIDRALERESLGAILAHPWRHLAVTLPLAMYGTPTLLPGLGPVNLLAFPLLIWLLWWSRRPERRWIAWAALPAAASIAFCCLLTHNISRYNYIAIPQLAFASVIAAWAAAAWWDRRRRSRA